MPKTTKQPKYTLHKASGNAIVRINGKQVYLGKYGSPESKDAYDRAILQWRQENDTSGKHTTTIGQLCLAYLEYAKQFYRDSEGNQTGEAYNFKKSLRHLMKFRAIPCSEFGPRLLVQLQTELGGKFVRPQVNKHISRIKTVFRWGIVREMVPEDVIVKLDCVKGLPKGRGLAKESEPKQPVPEADFVAAVEQMTPNVAVICKVLRLSAARVSEVRTMCVGDIDTSGPCWILKPQQHKNKWRGKDRAIPFGPQAQAVLMPFVGDATSKDLCVFRSGDENKPYTVRGLESSIRKACQKANVDHWSPGRLRHTGLTEVERQYGIDGARVYGGHGDKSTTEIYVQRDMELAIQIAMEIG